MSRPAKIQSFRLFFPAAALLAAAIVPLSVWAVQSGTGWPTGLLGAGHGHELLFGFALALIAGYTLGPQPARLLLPLFGLWLAARIAWILAPETIAAMILSPAFAVALAWLVVPRFQAAKKWRNRMLAPLFLVICLLPLVWIFIPWLASLSDARVLDQRQLMQFGILALLLLMMFMGGRIIAPAVGGTLEKKGIAQEARVQPRIEAALILTLAGAAVLLPIPEMAPVVGGLLLAASALLAVRIVRWRLWLCPERTDLVGFGLSYAWLAVGAAVTGSALIRGHSPAASLHLITVGALGSLSCAVALRLYFQRAWRQPPPGLWVWSTLALLSLAAIARFMAGNTPFAAPLWLWISATCWSVAFLGLAIRLALPLNFGAKPNQPTRTTAAPTTRRSTTAPENRQNATRQKSEPY